MIYGVAGPELALTPSLGVSGELVNPPREGCVFDFGPYFRVLAQASGRVSLLSKKLPPYEITIFNFQRRLVPPREACAEDSIAPNSPATVIANAASASSIAITWDAGTDNRSVASYELWRQTEGSQRAIRIQKDVAGTAYQDRNLDSDTNYCYFLFAVDGAGNVAQASSDLVCARTSRSYDSVAPAPPANAFAFALSTSAIILSWDAATDDVAVAGYLILDTTAGGEPQSVSQTDAAELSANITGLTPSTEYCFKVITVDPAGNLSQGSPLACATTNSVQQARWTMFLGCQGREYLFEELLDLDEEISSSIEVSGTARDYDNGSQFTYVVTGIYSEFERQLNGSISISFSTGNRRPDEFIVNLAQGDSGNVPMNRTQGGGCDALIRFLRTDMRSSNSVRQKQSETPSEERLDSSSLHYP